MASRAALTILALLLLTAVRNGRAEAYPSTYEPLPSEPLLITNATVLTGTGDRIDGGNLLLRDGRIAAVGESIDAPEGVATLDAEGRWVTPGLIDIHSHLGVFPSPGVKAHSDGNEATAPVTA